MHVTVDVSLLVSCEWNQPSCSDRLLWVGSGRQRQELTIPRVTRMLIRAAL